MDGLEKLKTGDFNYMNQEQLEDGSILITLGSRSYSEVYRFRVRNLYEPNEQELDVNTGRPLPKKRE